METLLGAHIKLDATDGEALVLIYKALLKQSFIDRARTRVSSDVTDMDIETKLNKYIEHITNWLDSTDFFACPASTRFHESHPSGLLHHSIKVYNQVVDLIKLPQFKGKVDIASATLAALTHDWCKIGRYETYYRNVKNPDTGAWESVPGYKTAQSNFGRLGHGVQSLTMVMQVCTHPWMSLTFEEMAAIRWHMGVYQVTDPEKDDLFRCNDMVPLVLLIQFADQLSITDYANAE